MIVTGATSQSLAAALAAELEEPLAAVDYDRFPDGELLASVPELDGHVPDRAVVVASTVSSDAHVELLQLQDAVREAGVGEVVTVLPYMGYARQDKPFEPGHPISARAVARAISTGTDRVLTVTPHEDAVCEFFEPTATAIDAAGRLAEPLPGDLTDPVFLSPDAGAVDLAETVRDAYGEGETDYFEKTRHSGTEVEISPSDVAVTGRDVVVTDDIIATGSTMSEAVAVLQERDVARVFVTCVHPLLARNAYAKLSRAGVEAIYGTDTIEREASAVSVAPTITTHL
ncbi:ribose-phosphate diphosphokinase [Natronobacterium gregoryi]|uniref:Ribose-phosphate pyrophosphokinase n=2 Tax=Natronobacterium gregoryi TaxID=44930 RepID=L0AHG3_NATGS|nr:ribose-phosphate diphosphokinase [Natronobacterium gregoryi]AFZ72884.1 ribose-phosphate pyrophosphokinase [Natronobacterium gregoryi SP2]ELY69624.1 ribose-phosphate pyrophosphokinase [Natronobacterium gregoryi SP2]PLK21887.1 ribose-phosphate diphosphokinase [Natronobacterium gregoryi SP2]SFI66411.1 ribose-phosphate pyrophosphokinase [Natronobacterium gregoryi]